MKKDDRTLKFYLNNRNFVKISNHKEESKAKEVLQVVDGRIVLNTDPIVIDDDNEITTSYTYMKRKGIKTRWTKLETSIFYRALECCGTEFSMINMLFPNKDRNNIKKKYKKEYKINPKSIETALYSFKKLNISKFNELKNEVLNDNKKG